mgnify:CR=1 FL=1
MLDPWYNMRRYLTWTFILIIFLIVTGVAVAGEKITYPKVTNIEPHEVDGQYCYVKIIITEKDNVTTKEEILECADGRKKFDGPGYWDLFAAFYYKDLKTPEYCRKYSRPNHAFKSYGTVCLDKNGEWEVK